LTEIGHFDRCLTWDFFDRMALSHAFEFGQCVGFWLSR